MLPEFCSHYFLLHLKCPPPSSSLSSPPGLLPTHPLSIISKSLVLERLLFNNPPRVGWGHSPLILFQPQLLPPGLSLPLDSDLLVIPRLTAQHGLLQCVEWHSTPAHPHGFGVNVSATCSPSSLWRKASLSLHLEFSHCVSPLSPLPHLAGG